jgi:hypothetical protein
MAHEIIVQNTSLVAAADYSAKQYYAVKVNASGLAELCGAGENALGILQDKPESGDVGCVMVLGESKAIYGATVAAGANLMTDASGRLITATGTNPVIAVAKVGGAVNEIHTVYLVTRTSSGANTKMIVSIPVPLAGLVTGDIVTTYTPGFAGTIVKISAVVTVATTDVDADATINMEIGTTNLTGGVVTLADSTVTPRGAVIDGTAITAANVFTAVDTISVEAVVTNAFTDGEITLLIVIQ